MSAKSDSDQSISFIRISCEFSPVYQVHQVGVLLRLLDERMPHQLLGTWPILWVLVQASFHKLLELLGEVARQLGRVVLRDEEENPHRVQVRVRGFTLQVKRWKGNFDVCEFRVSL